MAASDTIVRPHATFRRLVDAALATGEYEYAGQDGRGHGLIRHIPTGTTIKYHAHRPSDVNAPRNFAADIRRTSGHDLLHTGTGRRSRKVVRPSGYTPHRTAAEDAAIARAEALADRHRQIHDRLHAIARSGRVRAYQAEARRLVIEQVDIERQLAALHRPVPTYHHLEDA